MDMDRYSTARLGGKCFNPAFQTSLICIRIKVDAMVVDRERCIEVENE